MTNRYTPPSQEQLKQQWGLQRFVTALGIVSGWHLDKAHPISLDQLKELAAESQDALDVFRSGLYWSAQEWLDSQ